MCPQEQKKWPLIENKQAEKAFPGKSPSSLQHFEYISTSGCISEYVLRGNSVYILQGKIFQNIFLHSVYILQGKNMRLR